MTMYILIKTGLCWQWIS